MEENNGTAKGRPTIRQKRLQRRTHLQYAEWFYENHYEAMEALMSNEYGIELKYTKKQAIKVFAAVLKEFWNSFYETLYVRRAELYYSKGTKCYKNRIFSATLNLANYRLAQKRLKEYAIMARENNLLAAEKVRLWEEEQNNKNNL